MGILDAPAYVRSAYPGQIPAGLGWSNYSITPRILEPLGGGSFVGDIGETPEQLFASGGGTALTNPMAEFWVSTNGNDSNAGTQVAPFRSLQKVVDAANAAGVPTVAFIQAGVFERSRSFYSASRPPTVEIAWVAVGGRVQTGPFDLFTIGSSDATYTSTFTATVANCDRVLDTKNLDRYGNYTELIRVTTAEQCNRIPGSWALVSGTLYIHRADETSITTANTRVYRNQPFNYLMNTPQHLYMGGNGTGAGFDLEGSAGTGVMRLDMGSAGLTADPKIAVLTDSSLNYGGGAIGTSAVGLAVSSWHGLVAAFNCRADANATDGFNSHNGQGVSMPQLLTVGCSGKDNGRGASVSCQGLTIHENVRAIDIAGVYEGNRGGNIRNIDNSKQYALGTYCKDDKGDFANGGGVQPTGVRIDGSAELWTERMKVDQPRGQFAYATGTGTAKIHRRNCYPVQQRDFGPGVFDTY